MAPAPHGGHAAKHDSHKSRKVGEGHHHTQCHLQRRDQRKKQTMEIFTASLHLSALICKGLTVQRVNSE